MVQDVFFRLKKFHPVALAILGWLAFMFGLIVHSILLKLVLLSAARVLP